MALVLAFGVVLLVSVSLSGVAARTVLSTALLFLVAGAAIGPGGLGIVAIGPDDPIVVQLSGVALFTDGQRANVGALNENWKLSGRARREPCFELPVPGIARRGPAWDGAARGSPGDEAADTEQPRRSRWPRPAWKGNWYRCGLTHGAISGEPCWWEPRPM